MKRLTSISLLLFALNTEAATLWTEGFEEAFPPAGWTENSVDPSSTYAFNGTVSAKFSAAGDYLITPAISNATTFLFWSYTTSADPAILVEYAAGPDGPWTEFPESPFSDDTQQWNGRWVDLTNLGTIHIRIRKSGSGSLYVDDVAVEKKEVLSDRPPELDPIGDQSVLENGTLSFAVTASDPIDNDPVTLSATNLPSGAVFTNGVFSWNTASPAGMYHVTFIATDKDGSDSEMVDIGVIRKPKLMISEVADPAGTGGGDYRFVEIYNPETNSVDLTSGNWHVSIQINGEAWYDVALTGTVSAVGTYVVARDDTTFQTAYGFAPNQADANVNGTGNDTYALYFNGDHLSGVLIDIYGESDTSGDETAWEYTDSHAERKNHLSEPNPVWTAAEWMITSDAAITNMTPGQHGPMPQFQQLNNPFIFLGNDLHVTVTAVNTVRTDIITLSATALPDGASFSSETGTNSVSGILHWTAPPVGVYTVRFSAEGAAGTTYKNLTVTVAATAKIDGRFYGWENDTIVKLDNGQFWRNTGGTGIAMDPPLRNAEVTITNQWGNRRMYVESVTGYTTVEQINIKESTVIGTFTGLYVGTIYQLADSTIWKQVSFENNSSSVDPVAAWRWTENGATFMRLLDRNNTVIGTCRVIASDPPADQPTTTVIDGWFRGWKNGQIFSLANGQFWQQVPADFSDDILYRPTVTLTNFLNSGTWRLYVDGVTAPAYVEVRQLTNVTCSVISSPFTGLHHANRYELANNESWIQISFENIHSDLADPNVFIWTDSEDTRFLVRGANDERIGSCIVVDPDADNDGDDIANEAELIAGTALDNATDLFRLSDIHYDPQGRAVLDWQIVEGRIYTVEWAQSLNEPFQPLESAVSSPWIDTWNNPGTGGFYRLRVRLAD